MGEGPVADVMEQPGKSKRLNDQALGWELRGGLRLGQCNPQSLG